MINVEKIKPTGLFTNYIYKAIPLAFDESMSYYETLCGLLSYLKDTVIPALNNNADAIIEVQNLMTQLQEYVSNYFDNLDVQEEVNKKLDEMVEDGTIQSLLENYLNLLNVRYYETFTDALNDYENIPVDYYIVTNGFYENNDKGKGKYQIKSTDDGIGLQFGENYANLIIDKIINVKSLGIIGSESTDYTSQIQSVIDYAYTNNYEIEFNEENYYVQYLQFKTNTNGNNCIFYCGYFNSNNPVVINYAESNIICKNYTVDGLRLGSLANIRTDIRNKENIKLINVHTQNFYDTVTRNAWGILITSSHKITIENCSGINATQSDLAIVEDSIVDIINCNYEGLNIEPNNANNRVIVNIYNSTIDLLTAIGNSRTKMYILLNINNSIINEISPRSVVLNGINTIFNKINSVASYQQGSFRGNILNCISLGKELNVNPYLEDVIPETGSTLLNGYNLEYSPGPLARALTYKDIDGVGNILTLNPYKETMIRIGTDKYNVTVGKQYLVHVKYIAETTTANNVGLLLKANFYDSSNNRLLPNTAYISGVVKANENTGIQDDYIILTAPENAIKIDSALQVPDISTGEYQIIEHSIKEISSMPLNVE